MLLQDKPNTFDGYKSTHVFITLHLRNVGVLKALKNSIVKKGCDEYEQGCDKAYYYHSYQLSFVSFEEGLD